MKIRAPEDWSGPIQLFCCFTLFLIMFWAGNIFFLDTQTGQLRIRRQEEQALKETLQKQYQQANTLPHLQQQEQQFRQAISTLEQSYLSQDNMAALMHEVSTISTKHHLQLELFKPIKPVQKETTPYYLEQALQLKLHGHYHGIGLFLTDLGSISRLLHLTKLHLYRQGKNNSKTIGTEATMLTLEAELITYQQREPVTP